MNMVQTTTAGAILAWVLVYGLAWSACAIVDRQHCESFGVQYDSTSLGLTGYCTISGVRVPAGNLKR